MSNINDLIHHFIESSNDKKIKFQNFLKFYENVNSNFISKYSDIITVVYYNDEENAIYIDIDLNTACVVIFNFDGLITFKYNHIINCDILEKIAKNPYIDIDTITIKEFDTLKNCLKSKEFSELSEDTILFTTKRYDIVDRLLS